MSLEYIFVYGTLRSDCGGILAHWLPQHSEFVGTGFFQGTLFEVNRYPGVVPCIETQNQVLGEVYRLDDQGRILARLDDYEECSGRFPAPHEYTRVKAKIILLEGGIVSAWVYVYTLPVDRLEQIRSGDYARYLFDQSSF